MNHGWIFKRASIHGDEFWRGSVNHQGEPRVSLHRCDARVFKSHESALECAATHEALKDSDHWKAVKR
jgi:hypothetical protein